RARAASADARSVARSYSNRAGFMPPTSASSRRATDGLSFFWSDLSRHYPGDQGDREFLWRFTVPSDTSSLNLSDRQRRRVAARTQAACLNSSDRRAARHCNGSPPAQAPLRFAIFQKLAAVPRWHRSLRLIPSLVARNWSRDLQALGHTEHLIPRACVKPCVKQ